MILSTIKRYYWIFLIVCTTQNICPKQPPYIHEKAYTRIGTALCDQELLFLEKRAPQVKEAFEKLFDIPLEHHQIPRIALCTSGGGIRSMVATLGSLIGSQLNENSSIHRSKKDRSWLSFILALIMQLCGCTNNENSFYTTVGQHPFSLLDICTYAASLSGSSWAFAGLYHSRLSSNRYLHYIKPLLNKSFLSDINVEQVVINLLQKYIHGQPISLIDVYGCILARKLLYKLGTEYEYSIPLTSYYAIAQAATLPLPIHTALIGNEVKSYQWVEFTPFEVGSTYLTSFIPTWAFGRKFNKGISVDDSLSSSLGYGMGIWGSAISVSIKDFLYFLLDADIAAITNKLIEQKVIPPAAVELSKISAVVHPWQTVHQKDSMLDTRLSPATVWNWNCDMPKMPLRNETTLTLIDGGLDCSLPLVPLLRKERTVDIIIVLDNSSKEHGEELRKAERYAHKHQLAFPAIDYTKIEDPCSVHSSVDDPTNPLLIYMPLTKNSQYKNGWDPYEADFTSIFNFNYSEEQTMLLSGLTAYTMQENMPTILAVIKEWIEKHRIYGESKSNLKFSSNYP